MNDPGAQHPGDPVPLGQRYLGADPIDWCGAAVYPMYTEALPAGTTAVRLRALSVMPPPDVSGLGIGLSVQDGHVNLNGRSLAGVDIWSEALVDGIDISVTADAPDALFTLTPVWVAGTSEHQSWTGNYGMVVDLLPDGASTLWCSTGPGTPDFNELVVELTTGPAPSPSGSPAPSAPGAPVTVAAPSSPMPPVPAEPAPHLSVAVTSPAPPASATPAVAQRSPARPESAAPTATPAVVLPATVIPPVTSGPSAAPASAVTVTSPAARTPLIGSSPPAAPMTSPPPAPEAIDPAAVPDPTGSRAEAPDLATSSALVTAPLTPISAAAGVSSQVSAEQAFSRALYDLGTAMYARGEQDSARALWTQAAEAGHSGAAYDLGMLLMAVGDQVGAQNWLEAAARDDARAAASLTELSRRP